MYNIAKIRAATITSLCILLAIVGLGCAEKFPEPKTSADYATQNVGLAIRARSNGLMTQAFVAPMNEHGLIKLAPNDKLSIIAPGGREIPFVSFEYYEWIAQINTKASTFSVIFTRGAERFTSTVEMPPPFSLSAEFGYENTSRRVSFDVHWTPSSAGFDMVLLCVSGDKLYETEPYHESDELVGMANVERDKLQRPSYVYGGRSSSDDVVVTATRRGGKVTLDSRLANYPHAGRLEQIRTVLVTYPRPSEPAQIAEPAP